MVTEPSFHSFMRFACELKPGYASEVRGASAHEVRLLEQVAGVGLPPLYREVLLALGRGDGGLCLGMEDSLDIDQLIRTYRDAREDIGARWPCPPGYVLLSRDEAAEQICLTIEEPVAAWFTASERLISRYAESLIGLLHRDAFSALGVQGCRHRGFIAGRHGDPDSGSAMTPVSRLAVELGYVRQWYSDSIVSCHRSERGGMLRITRYEGEPLAVHVGAPTRREVLRVWWAFRRAFGLALVEWC